MTLYRFMDTEKTEDLLKNKRLMLSNPNYFNDPFDCSLAIKDDDEEYISKYNEYCSVPISCGHMVLRNPFANEINKYTNLINKAVTGVDIGEKNKWRICCFSKQQNWPEQILMWSLYANEHKGCMVEFADDFENYLKKKYTFEKVKYNRNRIHLNFSDTNLARQDKVYKALYYKSHAWRNEKEVRVLIPIGSFNSENKDLLQIPQKDGTTREFMKIRPEWIKKVYMGAKISDINREKIEKSTSKLGIQSEQIRLCAVNYELHSKSRPHTEEQQG